MVGGGLVAHSPGMAIEGENIDGEREVFGGVQW